MEFTGKTVEEAVNAGLETLKIAKEDAIITTIEEPVKGLFGKIKTLARVEISKKLTDGERAVKFLEGVFDKLELEAKAVLVEEGEKIIINVITTNSATIIGYRGEILDSLQNLASAVANTGKRDYIRVVVDCENYRQKREETLIALAHKLEKKATEQGRNFSLEAMSSYERRVIHSALADSQTVTTMSEGKEPNRFVVIVPNEKKERKPYAKKGFGDKKYGAKPKKSGFSEEIRKKPSGFGTFLGNSLKD
ncbi:MAG: protein jag [Clostridiales bacterium]|nr:protein jag [Clostridiales bacterium]